MQVHVGLSTWPCTIESSHSGEKRSDSSSSAQQVDDENNQGYHQQQMDQASRYMQAETKQPQNQKHHEDRPKHSQSPSCHVATVLLVVRKITEPHYTAPHLRDSRFVAVWTFRVGWRT